MRARHPASLLAFTALLSACGGETNELPVNIGGSNQPEQQVAAPEPEAPAAEETDQEQPNQPASGNIAGSERPDNNAQPSVPRCR